MKRINFATLKAVGIDGSEIKFDARMMLGNLLYMQGADIEECELGRRIYQTAEDEETELTEKEEQTIRRYVAALPYVYRQAITESLK